MRHTKLTYILVASFLLALCFIERKIYLLNSFLHELVNIFAGGRSGIKISLFLIFAVCILLLNIRYSDKVFLKYKIGWQFLTAWVAGIFAYNLMLYFVFIHKFGFKLTDFVIAFNNSEISSTKLLHTHVAKGAMGLLLSPFNLAQQENLDAGLVFLGLIPVIYFWITLLLLLLSVAIFIIYFKQHLASETKWNIFVSILYSIVAFSILKNFIDGGLFNRETLVAIAGLMLITLPKDKLKFAGVPVIGFILLLILSVLTGLTPSAEAWYNLMMALIFSSIAVTLWYWWKVGQTTRKGVLLAILCVVWLFLPAYAAVGNYTASSRTLSDSGSYLGLYETVPGLGEPVETFGQLNIYEINNEFKNQQEVFNTYHVLGNIKPLMGNWVDCFPNAPMETFTFDLITPKPVSLQTTHNKFGNIIKAHGTPTRHSVTAVIAPCSPRPLNILQEIINTQIAQPYFMVNIQENNNGIN